MLHASNGAMEVKYEVVENRSRHGVGCLSLNKKCRESKPIYFRHRDIDFDRVRRTGLRRTFNEVFTLGYRGVLQSEILTYSMAYEKG